MTESSPITHIQPGENAKLGRYQHILKACPKTQILKLDYHKATIGPKVKNLSSSEINRQTKNLLGAHEGHNIFKYIYIP